MIGAMNALQRGDWLIPTYYGDVRLQKPPLNYWLVACSFRLFGIGLWQARLPSALAGVLCIWLTYLLAGCAFSDRRVGLYAGCVLLSSYAFAHAPHLAMTDVVLTALMLAALYGLALTIMDGRRWGAVMAWAAMGAAFLQKGPVGVAVPLAGVVLWRFAARERGRVLWRRLFPPAGLALFAAIVLPWPILAMHRLGTERAADLWNAEIGRHVGSQLGRVLSGLLYYGTTVLRSLLPWSVLFLFYRRRYRFTGPVVLMCFFGLAPLATFALSVAMLRLRYVLVVMGPLAAMLGYAMRRLEVEPTQGPVLRRVIAWLLQWLPALAALGALTTLPLALRLVGTGPAFALAVAVLLVAASTWIAVRTLRSRSLSPHWIVAAAVGIAGLQCICWHVWPSVSGPAPAYDLARLHLRDSTVPAAVVRLYRTERDMASVGAGRELPSLGGWQNGAWEPFGWEEAAGFRLILIRGTAWAQAPPEVSRAWRQVGSMPIPMHEGLNGLLHPDGRSRARAPGQAGSERALIVLRRPNAPGGRPARP
jgi:4-amino-4-deoxy-L-arabinose transferase-like glycosyltransferase